MRVLNLGIVAHVDAGKTSLTERLLFDTGAIRALGSVDGGDTHTDSLELERQRGITIAAAVVSFSVGDLTVNLIDTPGHPDFIAEVERVVTLLDAAIVVVSAVEGVQPQTRVLVRVLLRLRIPFIFFVNKLDRLGADYSRTLEELERELSIRVLRMTDVVSPGTKSVRTQPIDMMAEPSFSNVCSLLTHKDEALMVDYIDDPCSVGIDRIRSSIAQQVETLEFHPAYGGVAMSGAGVGCLIDAIETILPSKSPRSEGPPAGHIFKIDRGWAGEKVSYLYLSAGSIAVRDTLELPGSVGKIIGLEAFREGKVVRVDRIEAGDIARITGLVDAKVGDRIGSSSPRFGELNFAPPTLETRIKATRPMETARLWKILSALSDQDPLINLRSDETNTEIYLSLYGEVQKEVIQETLLQQNALEVTFEETSVILTERIIKTGSAIEEILIGDNPYLATVGLRIEPRNDGAGNTFSCEVPIGQMPAGYYRAIEDACFDTLQEGLRGWKIIDCHISLTAIDQSSPATTAADFRKLTPLVLSAAIREAGTINCIPFENIHLNTPEFAMPQIQALLSQLGAVTKDLRIDGENVWIDGLVASSDLAEIKMVLPGISSGRAFIEHHFAGYRANASSIHARQRSRANPFDRKDYIQKNR